MAEPMQMRMSTGTELVALAARLNAHYREFGNGGEYSKEEQAASEFGYARALGDFLSVLMPSQKATPEERLVDMMALVERAVVASGGRPLWGEAAK